MGFISASGEEIKILLGSFPNKRGGGGGGGGIFRVFIFWGGGLGAADMKIPDWIIWKKYSFLPDLELDSTR